MKGVEDTAEAEEEDQGKTDMGGAHQTSHRGQNNKYGRMYTVGTSKCCAKYCGGCDPTTCVHIIQGDGQGYRGAADMKDGSSGGKRLHTITVYYQGAGGKTCIHRETHVHTEVEKNHHRSCIHIHLPRSHLKIKGILGF